MPSRAWPLWVLTLIVLVGLPAMNFVYWPQVLRSGVLPPDGDTIAIPMYGSVVFALEGVPFVIGVAWLCLRGYGPDTRLRAWRRDRPLRSLVATVVFVAPAAWLTIEGLILSLAAAQPGYEHLWSAYYAVVVLWLLTLRAAVIEQEPRRR